MTQMTTIQNEDFLPTRYSLLSRLQNWEDQDSWKDFFDSYWRLIYAAALKSGLAEAEAQDVVQETILCVARDINKFKRDRTLGSFKGWLRNLTRWRIADQLRKRDPANALLTLESTELPDENDAGLEKIWTEEWQANLMTVAMERVRRHVKEEHYQMFDLNVVRQVPAREVAELLGVNVALVYLAKHRVMALIRREVRLLEKQW
jgi:RNA polymerase sigma-70 factor (ECF subfamily)